MGTAYCQTAIWLAIICKEHYQKNSLEFNVFKMVKTKVKFPNHLKPERANTCDMLMIFKIIMTIHCWRELVICNPTHLCLPDMYPHTKKHYNKRKINKYSKLFFKCHKNNSNPICSIWWQDWHSLLYTLKLQKYISYKHFKVTVFRKQRPAVFKEIVLNVRGSLKDIII